MNSEQCEQLKVLLKVLSSQSFTELATLFIALASLIIALCAAVFTKHQRDISIRSEKYQLYTEVLEILYFLKSYNGEVTNDSKKYFRQLILLKAMTSRVFSKNAGCSR